jgi:hypothetical protein
MTSPAVTSQGTLFQIASGTGGAKTISGTVGVGNPTVLTSTAHGLSNGDVITNNSGFTGADASALNGKTYVVQFKTTNTFAVAQDTTGLTITVGTATVTATTYTSVGGITGISDIESGETPDIDVSDLDSTIKEYIAGLADNGSFTLALNFALSNAGQAVVQARRNDGATVAMKVVLPSGTTPTASFNGFVKKFSKNFNVDAARTGSVTVRVTGSITWA